MNKSIIPNIFTGSNLGFGVLGIAFSAEGLYSWAAVCVLLSLLADACDGRTARALGVAGPMGRELDSLADVVAFGVSPAFLIYSWSLYQLGWIGYIPLVLYSVLGAFRLARFNIMTTTVHGYFQGLAIPTAGCLCATYVLSEVHVAPSIIAVLMILLGLLMVSSIKYPDFKGKGAIDIHKLAIVIVLIVAFVLMIWNSHIWPVLPFVLYTLFGICNEIITSISSKK